LEQYISKYYCLVKISRFLSSGRNDGLISITGEDGVSCGFAATNPILNVANSGHPIFAKCYFCRTLLILKFNIMLNYFNINKRCLPNGALVLKLFLILIVMNSCKSITRISDRNLKFLYYHEENIIGADFLVFHKSFDKSSLYYRINRSSLEYRKSSEEEPFVASVNLSYEIFDSYSSNELVDSLSITVFDTLDNDKNAHDAYIKDFIALNIPSGTNYVMKIDLQDVNNKETRKKAIIDVNKTEDDNSQYFKLYYEEDSLIFPPNFLKKGNYTLKYKHEISEIYEVSIFKDRKEIALPPFSEKGIDIKDITHDAVFQLDFEKGIASLQIEVDGIYRVSNEDNAGFYVYNFYDGYPAIVDDYQMLLPLRYLSTGKEFEKLLDYDDAAVAVDVFWTEMAGTPLRGRKKVDRFYDNIEKSNKLFTTWKEGWKTDRGMIYSVFGSPDHIIKNDESERWIYHGGWEIPRTEFTFIKTEIMSGMHCFVLDRKPEYSDIWFRMVDNIRN